MIQRPSEMGTNEFGAWANELCAGLTDDHLKVLRQAAQAAQCALPENAHWAAIRESVKTSDDLEVDDDAVVSVGDGGAFVQAWAWAPAVEDDDGESV